MTLMFGYCWFNSSGHEAVGEQLLLSLKSSTIPDFWTWVPGIVNPPQADRWRVMRLVCGRMTSGHIWYIDISIRSTSISNVSMTDEHPRKLFEYLRGLGIGRFHHSMENRIASVCSGDWESNCEWMPIATSFPALMCIFSRAHVHFLVSLPSPTLVIWSPLSSTTPFL